MMKSFLFWTDAIGSSQSIPLGLGDSGPSTAGYDTAHISKVLADAIQSAIDGSYHLVGHDVGAWIAYASDESGTQEVYVRSFTRDGHIGANRQRVSSSGDS